MEEAKTFYTLEEIEDKYIGEKGTPKRDAYEEELNSFLMDKAIKLKDLTPRAQSYQRLFICFNLTSYSLQKIASTHPKD